ncbi:MAG: rhodanese-like domain-containing protein [Burkholderiaceae bacterium]
MNALHEAPWVRRRVRVAACAALLLHGGLAAAAEFKVLVSVDPADGARGMIGAPAAATALSKAVNGSARVFVSKDLKDAMRATRTGENQMIVGPAHVIASALSHGYVLAAVSGSPAKYALVARSSIARTADLASARLYLPQQDSLRSYIARALLEQANLALKTLKQVEYRNTSGAGLIAIGLGLTDATVAELSEAQAWIQANPGKATILSMSQDVPGGMGLALHASVSAADRERIARLAAEPNSPLTGIAEFRFVAASSEKSYAYVALLGIVTPETLPGATVVSAEQVRDLLIKGGVAIVDTRSAKEFAAEHIAQAVLAAYGEKSLKERDYDASLDDLSAIAKLDRARPTVFLCNGPECWKSYKAAREALKMGFTSVYWFRGGMPEWRARGLPVLRGDALATTGKP